MTAESLRNYHERSPAKILGESLPLPVSIAIVAGTLAGSNIYKTTIDLDYSYQPAKVEAPRIVPQHNFIEMVDYVPNVILGKEVVSLPLDHAIIPNNLTIPSLGIVDVPIQPGVEVIDKEGKSQIIPPSKGIATANNIVDSMNNNIWIYGHSLFQGEPQTFSKLQNLDTGEKLIINGEDRTRYENLTNLEFEVEKKLLGDMESGSKLLFGQKQDTPRIIIQTSIREVGSKHWIFDRNETEKTTEPIVEGDLDNPEKYLLLFIVASPTAETLARLRSNQ